MKLLIKLPFNNVHREGVMPLCELYLHDLRVRAVGPAVVAQLEDCHLAGRVAHQQTLRTRMNEYM